MDKKWGCLTDMRDTAPNCIFLFSGFLKGGTDGILRAGREAGTYRDGSCVTVAFAVVIHAVVNITVDPLDVLLAVSGFTVLVLFAHHDSFSFILFSANRII